jgi:hypothetical protein
MTYLLALIAAIVDKADVIFDIKLPAAPKHSPEFSRWRGADLIGEPDKPQACRATSTGNYETRYRAEWRGRTSARAA